MMSWRRRCLEAGVSVAARLGPPPARRNDPASIFVLRNNDIGDLLVVTPLFEALRTAFPSARIVAGVGRWNVPVLEHNPHVSETLEINAPWHNQQVSRHRDMSARGLAGAARYILASDEAKRLRDLRCDVGVDVLGSAQGSLLLLRCGVPYRLGVRGYAGGHSAAHRVVTFDVGEHVGRASLRFAELLGASSLPQNRPQIFLSPEEREAGIRRWPTDGGGNRPTRVVIGPGGGFSAKRWPLESFKTLTRFLDDDPNVAIRIAGGEQDIHMAESLAAGTRRAVSLAGKLRLRETFALVAAADIVICNSSMLMHAAAAFQKPAVVLLGYAFESALQHARQWAHPETIVLGKEPGERMLPYHPEEVLSVVRRRLLSLS